MGDRIDLHQRPPSSSPAVAAWAELRVRLVAGAAASLGVDAALVLEDGPVRLGSREAIAAELDGAGYHRQSEIVRASPPILGPIVVVCLADGGAIVAVVPLVAVIA
jgi:hypothetical protein